MYDDTSSRKRQILATLAVLVVIVVIVGGVGAAAKKDTSSSGAVTTSDTTSPTTTTPSVTTTTSTTTNTDGTYAATGSYGTPGGVNSIDLSVTIKDGVVTSASASTTPPDRESKEYDQRFLSAYKSYIIGKNVNQISLSRVSGASLTTEGFDSAIQKIANQAKA